MTTRGSRHLRTLQSQYHCVMIIQFFPPAIYVPSSHFPTTIFFHLHFPSSLVPSPNPPLPYPSPATSPRYSHPPTTHQGNHHHYPLNHHLHYRQHHCYRRSNSQSPQHRHPKRNKHGDQGCTRGSTTGSPIAGVVVMRMVTAAAMFDDVVEGYVGWCRQKRLDVGGVDCGWVCGRTLGDGNSGGCGDAFGAGRRVERRGQNCVGT